ncbi:MocR-like pyridoxine biosynthesis transcription factor PdxR [Cupriavidus sp. RAF12]|uniref:MocR-like pyridoxine biosynthesis transcription factor PdxR n=1 Tax=Cupriavidus sp. RAF12 TaxID=3233050 RepID=UPI003F92C73E
MEPVFALEIALPPRGSRTLLRALHGQLRAAILDGRLAPGLRLPSSRELAGHYTIARNTVIAVYDLLLSEGYVTTQPGGGTFVAAVVSPERSRKAALQQPSDDARLQALMRDLPPVIRMAPTRSFEHDFVLGLPDKHEFPFDIWRRLSGRALRALSKAPASYAEPEGRAGLREAIASHVSFARAVACGADDIVVTAGAQQAFNLIARVLVRPGKTVVAVEDPGYPPMRNAFLAAGATMAPVRVDADGLVVDDIPRTARVICVTPSHQFPLGVTMSMPRRQALLDFARQHQAVVIEDDYDSEFRHGGRTLDALQTLDQDQSVWYVGTFSKSLFPELRLGYVVVPPWAHAAVVGARQCMDWHSPPLAQDTLAAFMAEGHLARHIRKMRTIYSARREALLLALRRHCAGRITAIPPDAGLHLGASLEGSLRAEAVAEAAARAGIRVHALGGFAIGKTPAPNALGFGFGMIDAARIEPAIRKLAGALGQST